MDVDLGWARIPQLADPRRLQRRNWTCGCLSTFGRPSFRPRHGAGAVAARQALPLTRKRRETSVSRRVPPDPRRRSRRAVLRLRAAETFAAVQTLVTGTVAHRHVPTVRARGGIQLKVGNASLRVVIALPWTEPLPFRPPLPEFSGPSVEMTSSSDSGRSGTGRFMFFFTASIRPGMASSCCPAGWVASR